MQLSLFFCGWADLTLLDDPIISVDHQYDLADASSPPRVDLQTGKRRRWSEWSEMQVMSPL